MKIGTSMGLMVLVAALLMGTAAADNPDTCAVSGSVDAVSLSVDASNGAVSGATFARGDTWTKDDALVAVTANAAWSLAVSDAINGGYMVDGSSNPLTDPFYAGPHGETLSALTSEVSIEDEGDPSGSAQTVAVDYSQAIAGDEAAGTYSITLTYTVSTREL